MRKQPLRIGMFVAAPFVVSISAQITVPSTPPPQTRAGGNVTAKPPGGPTPRKPNGHPDLTGVWLRRAGIVNIEQLLPRGALPFRPETLKRMSLLKSQDDPQLRCLPVATPRSEPYPFRIVETPTHIFILMEAVHGYRQVFMDDRKHPSGDDLQLSWQGRSLMEYICDNEQDAPNIDAPADAAIDATKLLKDQR
jgi:hypothetical protein